MVILTKDITTDMLDRAIEAWFDSDHLEFGDYQKFRERMRSALVAASALYSDVEPLVEALRMAVRQNSHDMLMTGEEIRRCVTVLTTIDAQERGV